MKNIFKIGNNYIVRHNILKELYDSSNKEKDPQRPKIRLSDAEICDKTNFSLDDIRVFHEELHDLDEINCNYDCRSANPPETHLMLITSKGRHAYVNKKYLKEGRKAYWDGVYDPIKIILPFLTILISGTALYLNYRNSQNNNTLKSQMELQNNRIDSMSMANIERQQELQHFIENFGQNDTITLKYSPIKATLKSNSK